MKAQSKFIIVLSILLVLFLGWRFMAVDRDVRAINQNLQSIAELVSKTSEESQIEGLGRARRVRNYVQDGAELQYLPRQTFRVQGDAMAGTIAAARSQVELLEIRLSDHAIRVHDDREHAISTVQARARIVAGGEPATRTHRYELFWQKVDGDWMLARSVLLE